MPLDLFEARTKANTHLLGGALFVCFAPDKPMSGMQEGKQQRVRRDTRVPNGACSQSVFSADPPWQIYMVEFNIAGLTQREESTATKATNRFFPSGRRRGKVLSFACSRISSMEFAERREFRGGNLCFSAPV